MLEYANMRLTSRWVSAARLPPLRASPATPASPCSATARVPARPSIQRPSSTKTTVSEVLSERTSVWVRLGLVPRILTRSFSSKPPSFALAELVVTPGTRVSVSATFLSGILPMSSAVMTSSILSASRLASSDCWTAAGMPVILAGENGGVRLAALPFPLQESDWPLRVSFPVAVTNLLRWMAPGLTLGSPRVAAGGTLPLFPPPGISQLTVVRPGGVVDTVHAPFATYRVPVQPGIYTVRAGTAQAPFAVNAFPGRTAPATGPGELWLGTVRPSSTDRVAIPMPLGWVFAVVALGVLSTEWWSAYRR